MKHSTTLYNTRLVVEKIKEQLIKQQRMKYNRDDILIIRNQISFLWAWYITLKFTVSQLLKNL